MAHALLSVSSMSIDTPPGTRPRPRVAVGPRLLLTDHHLDMEDACFALRACECEDDPRELVQRYRDFESGLLAHIETEELHVLPAYAAEEPADAVRVRAEHAALREQLVALGVETELHVIQPHTLERFIKTLRDHARHEEVGMYPWAQINLPLLNKREIFARIGRSLRELMLARIGRRHRSEARRLATKEAPRGLHDVRMGRAS